MAPDLLARAIELQRKCWTHERIAKELGVSRVTVSRALAKHNRKVARRLTRRAADQRAKQVVQLEWLLEQAVLGWHRSRRDAEIVKETEAPVGEEGAIGMRTERTRKGQAGDKGFLAEARGALADIRKILGLDAPTKIEQQHEFSDLSDDDLIARIKGTAGGGGPPGPDHPGPA